MAIYEKLWPDKSCCINDTYDIFHEFPLNLGIGKLKLWHLIIQDDKRLCVIPVIIHVIYIVRIYQENGIYYITEKTLGKSSECLNERTVNPIEI